MQGEYIHRLYNQYTENIHQIHSLETRLSDEIDNENTWKTILYQKAEFTKNFYIHTVAEYNRIILPFIDDPSLFTMDIIDLFLKEIYEFTKTNLYDQLLTSNVLLAILQYLDTHDSLERRIVCYHFLAVHIERINTQKYIKASANYFHKIIQYEPYIYTGANPYVKSCIVKSFYNYIMREMEYPEAADLNEVLRVAERCEHIYSNSKIRQELDSLFDFDSFSEIIRQALLERLSYFTNHCNPELYNHLYQKFIEFVSITEQKINSNERLGATEFSNYYHNKFMLKEISAEEYIMRCKDYLDAISVPDSREGAESFFHSDYFMSVQSIGVNLITAFNTLSHITEEQQKIKSKTLISIRNTLMFIPKINELRSFTDRAIYDTVKLLAPYLSDEEIVDLILQFAVTRQTTTAIHSRMVANISIAILEHIANEHKELLTASLSSYEIFQEHHDGILNYMYNCGLFHDIGKARISNIVRCDYRRLTDTEFDAIKEHTTLGYEVACESPFLYQYRTIIEGHHKYYNDVGGYPEQFVRANHHVNLIRDILSIADSLDAATDMFGRNYHHNKSIETVLQEMKDDNGRQYNPQIVNCIADCPDFTNYLKRVCGEEQRYEVIRKVYIAQKERNK